MSQVSARLSSARAESRAALIGYLPAGFPDPSLSRDLMAAMVDGGVDIVEVGLPYSDPVLDGPTIAAAADTALRAGTRTADVLAATAALTARGAAALVMTYWNPIERYGVPQFAADLAASGGGGLITPDLTPDEAGDWLAASEAHQLDRVFLVAPSSTTARIKRTVAACRGFVYAASLMGVTGARAASRAAAPELVARVRAHTDLPVCVGLGVSTPEQATAVAGYADGVIVGTAFVRAVLGADSPKQAVTAVGRLAEALATGVRSGHRSVSTAPTRNPSGVSEH